MPSSSRKYWLMGRYLLTGAGLLVWMFFFDDRDIITTYIRHPRELRQLEESKRNYQEQIAALRKESGLLKSSAATLEKYAREKYFMKRDNEDVFIIKPEP
ncbi:MAG: septum formation initiator family protein [Williamsia sp.]|nr:septum formation initiator family protein [Williamsia sp.]